MREKYIVKAGEKRGRLTVLSVEKSEKGIYLICSCDCGNTKRVYKSNFLKGKSKSCGCYCKEVISRLKTKHGKAGSRDYAAWRNMLTRCYNKNSNRYATYGGRGIAVCERWKGSFEAFHSDMGPRPSSSHSIGRMDNDAGYSPSNCRWELPHQQNYNTTRTRRGVIDDKEVVLAFAAKEIGISCAALSGRIKSGNLGDDLTNKNNLSLVCIDVDGESKPTTHWMREAGIPISSFYHFLRKGMTRPEVVKMYLAKKAAK